MRAVNPYPKKVSYHHGKKFHIAMVPANSVIRSMIRFNFSGFMNFKRCVPKAERSKKGSLLLGSEVYIEEKEDRKSHHTHPDDKPHYSLCLWQDQRPTLQILSSNEIHKVCLDEYSHISIKVDQERRCVGTYIDGEYRACPHNSLTQSTDRCQECTYEQFFGNCDILNVEHLKQGKNCIFHPLCSKEELNSLKKDILCCKIHVVYLAVFGEVLKIGITQNMGCTPT
jgi:hypothetical protein